MADGGGTVKDLQNIITAPSKGLFMMPSDAYNEVFEGILIGEQYVIEFYLVLKTAFEHSRSTRSARQEGSS